MAVHPSLPPIFQRIQLEGQTEVMVLLHSLPAVSLLVQTIVQATQ